MKQIIPLIAVVASVGALNLCSAMGECRSFDVDATKPGRVLPNPQQTLTIWCLSGKSFANVQRNRDNDVLSFAEYVEVMGATGGEPKRDCLSNPKDRSVTDDYDFSSLVAGCRNLVDLRLRPYLKLGNVPQKFSDSVDGGDFAMNIRPPRDYDVYGRYMKACAEALLAAFGRDELLKWRFAVLTEYENGGWFKDASGDPEKTFRAYCRLYEVTAKAFASVISPDIEIGAHAMAVTEGLWDERRFLGFVAERKLPIKFLTASFYDTQAGVFTSGLTLPQTISHLRTAAEAVGLTNLTYAVDEGRVLNGRPGVYGQKALNLRVVGDTYQAAYDARIVRQIFESGAEYFASWGFLSGPNTWFEGLPSVSFHVARETAAFKGMRSLPSRASGLAPIGIEAESFAALAPDGLSMRVMAYAFTNSPSATGSCRLKFRVRLPAAWNGRSLTVTRRQVDDDANWYDEWRADRVRLGIDDKAFLWSPDDPAVMSGTGLTREADRQRFRTELEPRYRECARLRPVTIEVPFPEDGVLTLERNVTYNAALFMTIAPEPEVRVTRQTAGTNLRGTALLVHPEELTETWIDRAADLGVTTLSIHPWGGGWAVRSLEDLLSRCRRLEFRRLIDRAWEKGLRVEYEAHVGSWLLPREQFAEHPEYFCADASGVRTNRFNFCVSNAAAMEIVKGRARQLATSLYRSSPRYFLWLDDAPNSECHCDACKALSASDQQMIVLNQLLAALREVVPEAQLAYLAYFTTMSPPTKVRPAEGIFLEYAPITRVWDKPLSEQPKAVKSNELDALLNLFGRQDARVLEYWFDNSLFSKWTKPEKRFAVNKAVLEKDLAWYKAKGFDEIASFACYLGPGYEKQWGAPDLTAFRRDSELSLKGLWSSAGGRDNTDVSLRFGEDGLHFSFRVKDATPTRIDTFRGEGDVAAVDRVELYLSPTADLSKTYRCLEMSPQGYVLDYAADTFRQFRRDWNCRSLKIASRYTADGYEVSGTISAQELKELGLTRSNLHLGIYRADFASGGKLVSWLSAMPITANPDFHRPGTLFPL